MLSLALFFFLNMAYIPQIFLVEPFNSNKKYVTIVENVLTEIKSIVQFTKYFVYFLFNLVIALEKVYNHFGQKFVRNSINVSMGRGYKSLKLIFSKLKNIT